MLKQSVNNMRVAQATAPAVAPVAVPSRRRPNRLNVQAQATALATTQAKPIIVGSTPVKLATPEHLKSMVDRHSDILGHFPTAMAIDDFMSRVEIALAGFGFTGDNSIAHTNLCRDEVTLVLKDKIEAIFGASFNTNGLGGVLTCGVTGIKAGLSHSPVCVGGRERYVFFSFPHIAINSDGEVGALARPGRPKQSCACGALLKCLGEFKAEAANASCKNPGLHDPLEPEYSILKQRLARRIRYEDLDPAAMDLCSLTAAAERTITDDLEYLVEKAVNPEVADYAVITGIEIHNWASELVEGGAPSMEFVAPTKAYVVINGVKTHLDLLQVPPLSFRQLQLIAERSLGGVEPGEIAPGARSTVLQEIPYEYLAQRMGGATANTATGSASAARAQPVNLQIAAEWPSWQSRIRRDNTAAAYTLHQLERDMNAPTMESPERYN